MVSAGVGAGGAEGVGTAIAPGADAGGRATGVSDGFGDADFLGVFSGIGFFFFGFGVVSFAADFLLLDFGVAVASGVFFGVADGVSSSGVAFRFALGFGDGDADFDLCFAALALGDGLGDSSGLAAAERVLRNSARFCFSSSVSCP